MPGRSGGSFIKVFPGVLCRFNQITDAAYEAGSGQMTEAKLAQGMRGKPVMKINQNKASLEIDREAGKQLLFSHESSHEEKNRGIALLLSCCRQGDPESQYLIGKMLLEGSIALKNGDSKSRAMSFLIRAARNGYYPARSLLSVFCQDRYDQTFSGVKKEKQPLTDFDGKRFVIKHTGKLTPIDAVLSYSDGRNTLTLSLNLMILDEGVEVADPQKLRDAVFRGIRLWEGEYTVFGGQQLQIKINISEEPRLFDNVIIGLMAGETLNMINQALRFSSSKAKERTRNMIRDKRSMAVLGFRKWSVRSRKIIYLHSKTNMFDDYEEIMHVVKHEFGHALGLGDLYEEAKAGLQGVPAGCYEELDSYILKDKFYNLVMCDHYGIISNNDIEMVVLAFSENRLQQYQPKNKMTRVSKALGRGN